MGWAWNDPWSFERPGRHPLALLGESDMWWLHQIRDGLRIAEWKIAGERRDDMQGLTSDYGIDKCATLAKAHSSAPDPADKGFLHSCSIASCLGVSA